jgi:vancomycin resistance protein YoaR
MYRNAYLLSAAGLLLGACPVIAQIPKPTNVKPAASAADRLAYKITLTDGVRTVVRTRRELGIRVASENPVRMTADLTALKAALTRLAPKFQQEAIGARPVVYKGQFSVREGTYSRSLNVPTTAQRFADAIAKDAALKQFTVSFEKKPPVLTAARLKGITGVLGTMTTRTSDNSSRNTNIQIAVESIDGTLLSPGETFSLNETVGKRTKARGFEEATVFVNAEKVPGVGGGVSQVTGTLFNAAALAGLAVLEVNPHSRPVAYLPLGRDATVAWQDKDLKFKNNTDSPVFLAMTFQKNVLTATVYGKKTDARQVTLKPQVQKLGPGKINASLYRVIRERGRVVEKAKLLTHAYRWDATD